MTCSLCETGLTFRCHISKIPEIFCPYLHKLSLSFQHNNTKVLYNQNPIVLRLATETNSTLIYIAP